MADTAALLYTAEHEWIAVDGDSDAAGRIVTIGITAYAAEQLGDVVYVDLPKVGRTVTGGAIVGEIESTKSVGELYAPVDGEVVEINEAVVATPELVNAEPFDGGWLIKVRVAEVPGGLLSADDYAALIAG